MNQDEEFESLLNDIFISDPLKNEQRVTRFFNSVILKKDITNPQQI